MSSSTALGVVLNFLDSNHGRERLRGSVVNRPRGFSSGDRRHGDSNLYGALSAYVLRV